MTHADRHQAGREFTGTVKWFNDAKGYGFITVDGRGAGDVFVHYSAIEPADRSGYRSLEDGARVAFDVVPGRKGSQAARVVPIP